MATGSERRKRRRPCFRILTRESTKQSSFKSRITVFYTCSGVEKVTTADSSTAKPRGNEPLLRSSRRLYQAWTATVHLWSRLSISVQERPAPRVANPSRSSTGEDAQQSGSHLYQLVVRPILKTTISQRDSSGETLEDFAVNGSSFRDIFPKLWERFSPRVKGRAVKAEEEWSLQPPAMEDWSKVMQFKAKRHIVDSAKSDRAWNAWLHATREKLSSYLCTSMELPSP
ncbi:hypothetical protein GQ600_15419 [Phytophthora cactorum]|nr:hypothetical protein GQ600_15419 [Phytophthora cactorum]